MKTNFDLSTQQTTLQDSASKPKQIKRFFTDEQWMSMVIDALNAGQGKGNLHGHYYENGKRRYFPDRAVIQPDTLDRLRIAHPDFDRRVGEMIERNGSANNKIGRERGAAIRKWRTHCPNGHPRTPDNIRVYKEGSHLSRRCLKCMAIKSYRGGRPVTPDLEGKVMQMLRDGYPARAITHGFVGTEKKFKVLVKPERLYRHLEAHPLFASQFNALATKNREASRQRGAEKSRQFWAAKRSLLPPKPPKIVLVRSPLHALNEPGVDVMLAVRAAIPTYLKGDIRDEVEATMLLAFYEGRIRLEDFHARAGEFIRAANKMHPTTFARGAFNAPLSLDAAAYRDSSTPLVDTVSQGLWD